MFPVGFRLAVGNQRHDDGAAHHKGQAGIPLAGDGIGKQSRDVQKANDLGWIGHAGENQAGGKHQAGDQADDDALCAVAGVYLDAGLCGTHAAPPAIKPVTVTVSMAAAMKTTTAISERAERRPKPQTPWPDVQPLPRTVP